jgi:hypothetical protein
VIRRRRQGSATGSRVGVRARSSATTSPPKPPVRRLVGITPQRPRFDPVRAAVRLAFRAHICGLVPATNVNWLADSSRLVSVTSTLPTPRHRRHPAGRAGIGLTRKYLIVTGPCWSRDQPNPSAAAALSLSDPPSRAGVVWRGMRGNGGDQAACSAVPPMPACQAVPGAMPGEHELGKPVEPDW